jgi:hypothetical protein
VVEESAFSALWSDAATNIPGVVLVVRHAKQSHNTQTNKNNGFCKPVRFDAYIVVIIIIMDDGGVNVIVVVDRLWFLGLLQDSSKCFNRQKP